MIINNYQILLNSDSCYEPLLYARQCLSTFQLYHQNSYDSPLRQYNYYLSGN